MAKIISTEVRKRGIFGKLWKWLFIIFNVLMGIWVVTYWAMVAPMMTNQANTTAENVGAVAGATLGTGALIVFWAAGAAILGGLAMATRGKKIIVQETVE